MTSGGFYRSLRSIFSGNKASRATGKPKYTFIVATYNVEKYLAEFIDSLVAQYNFRSDVQLIFVDDGSTDNSAAVIKKYADIHPNIEYYYKVNGGQASARNLGLEKAKGTWVSFADPDDFVSEDYLYSALSSRTKSYTLSQHL